MSNRYTLWTFFLLLLARLLMAGSGRAQEGVSQSLVDMPRMSTSGLWPDLVPAGCPFQKSERFGGVEFPGRHVEYGHADTWYPLWAKDGKMYSPLPARTITWLEVRIAKTRTSAR